MKDLHQIFAKSTMIQLNKVCEKVKDTPYNVIKAWLLDNDNDNVIASRLGISLNTTKRLYSVLNLEGIAKGRTRVDKLNLTDKDWRLLVSTQTLRKLESAEDRLKETVDNLVKRWVVEKVPLSTICLKLDISVLILDRIINALGLREHVESNKKDLLFGRVADIDYAKVDWRTRFKAPVRKELEGAEKRLNESIYCLLNRWLAEKVDCNFISLKLNVSTKTVTKLLEIYGLDAKSKINIKAANKIKASRFKGVLKDSKKDEIKRVVY